MKILKIPYSAGCLGKNIGTEKAPDAVLAELNNLFVNESKKSRFVEAENVEVDNSNISVSQEKIRKAVKEGLVIGGDHSITYSAFKGSGCDGLLILDAHADCMEGTDAVTHEDFARKLVDEGAKVVLAGVRDLHRQELDFIQQKKILCFTMKEIFELGIKEFCDAVMENCRQFKSLYLSIDIDVADPAFAPGTGYTVAGGLSSRELIYLVQRLKLLKNLKVVDIVEVNPKKDRDNITVKLAAKIVNELF